MAGWPSQDVHPDAMDMSLSRLWEMVRNREARVLQSMGLQRVRHDWATEQQHILMEINIQRRWLAKWVLILRIICRAIVGNYDNG